MARELPMEHRYLGDNSVTECFAFLFQHLAASPAWLSAHLGVEDPGGRRGPRSRHRSSCSCAATPRSCRTSWSCTASRPRSTRCATSTRGACRTALHIDWPAASWLSDVDSFFYVACYLRAWALETHLRRVLTERFGERWFEQREAGDFLQGAMEGRAAADGRRDARGADGRDARLLGAAGRPADRSAERLAPAPGCSIALRTVLRFACRFS